MDDMALLCAMALMPHGSEHVGKGCDCLSPRTMQCTDRKTRPGLLSVSLTDGPPFNATYSDGDAPVSSSVRYRTVRYGKIRYGRDHQSGAAVTSIGLCTVPSLGPTTLPPTDSTYHPLPPSFAFCAACYTSFASCTDGFDWRNAFAAANILVLLVAAVTVHVANGWLKDLVS